MIGRLVDKRLFNRFMNGGIVAESSTRKYTSYN